MTKPVTQEVQEEAERIHDLLFKIATSREMMNLLKTVYWQGREDGKALILALAAKEKV